MPSSRKTSLPGRIGTCWSAARAVRLRRGSTTTNWPPRACSAFSRPGSVRDGPQAAVGRVRVGAEDQQEVGAIDVGHGDRERAAEQVAARHVLGHLVQRGRGEDVLRAERLAQRPGVQVAGERVDVRVAEVHGDRVAAVLVDDPGQAGRRRRRTPRPRWPAASLPSRRIRGVRSRSGSASSWPNEAPLGQRKPWLNTSLVVTPYPGDLVGDQGELQTAGRLAQRTCRVLGARHAMPPCYRVVNIAIKDRHNYGEVVAIARTGGHNFPEVVTILGVGHAGYERASRASNALASSRRDDTRSLA